MTEYISNRRIIMVALFQVINLTVWAQQPVIREVDKSKGALEDTISIKGNGFGTNAAVLQVWFGGARATITSASDQLVQALVPAGATYDKISLINTTATSGLMSFATKPFLFSFGGTSPLSAANFAAQVDFQGLSGLYDLCLCDFNGDGKTDVGAANDNTTSFAVFANNSTAGTTVTLTRGSSNNIAKQSIHSACGDLNGDGKPDLILSEDNGSSLIILQNTTPGVGATPAFGTLSQVVLTGKKTKRIEIEDLDRDGKPELIVTNQQNSTIEILRNNSTTAAISFETDRVTLTPAGTLGTDGLAVSDLNNDGKPEVIASQTATTNSAIFIFQNQSISGNLSFVALPQLTLFGSVQNLKVGDLDGDQKPDLAASQLIGVGISIFLNQSSSSSIAFSAPFFFQTDDKPWGLDFGDLDGDGKADIAVASIERRSITVLNNASTPGNLSFQRITLATTVNNRHVRIGDIDGDAKPDLAFISLDNSRLSVIRNKVCLTPVLDPAGPINICSGSSLTLHGTRGRAVNYVWKKDGAVVPGATPELPVNASGSYTLTARSEGGACEIQSSPVVVTVSSPSSLTGTAIASGNSPVCTGSTLALRADGITAGTATYKWTGPEGFSSTEPAPEVSNFSLQKAGRYKVSVFSGACLAQESSILIEGLDVPTFSIDMAGGSGLICQGNNKVLSVSPVLSGFSYQWSEESTGPISGATTASLTVSDPGRYKVTIEKSPALPGCASQNPGAEVKVVAPAVADFSISPTEQPCQGQLITFTNQSIADPQATPSYTWSFGDGSALVTDVNPQYTYTVTGRRTVKLTASYNGLCAGEKTKEVLVSAAPVVTITQPNNRFSLCPDENLELGVSGGPFTSYQWSTGATSPTAAVSAGGEVRVEVQNSIGCILRASRNIEVLPAPVITVVSDPEEIRRGESAKLTATGLQSFTWSPAETLSDATSPSPIATPLEPTTYTVTGLGSNGCQGQASVEVRIRGEAIVNLLSPSNSFSPNGDAQNELWTIGSIESFQQCGVVIYDDKGIKVFEAKPYINANGWDGTNNGKKLPQGVYFYIIRCEGQEGTPRTGSITILR